ncbi:hypothetical protein BN975_05539 [Mycolicibacterium farcinogenes]|nr:hypothetical protein BN975_05539 [Mycolicibacterium farcinogenes]
MRIAVCSGSCVVAAKVTSIATADSGATRSTSLMSGSRPTTSSAPITRISPPITGIGMISAAEPATNTSTASHSPAKMPAHLVWAPAEVATPVRDSEPPAGSAPNMPPATFAAPWARKSPFILVRLPSGLGTAAEIPAAWASATSATATPPTSSSGIAAKFGTVTGGSAFAIDAMSPTVSTSMWATATTAVTTTRASSVANDSSGLMK